MATGGTTEKQARDELGGLRGALTTPRRTLMNDPMFDWARPRLMRRRLVVALGGLILASGAAVAAGPLIGKYLSAGALALLLLPMVVTIGQLNASVRGLTGLKTGDLDEWQIARRDAAFRQCWWPAILVLGGAGYAAVFLPLSLAIKGALVLAASFAGLVMPVALLAWTLPDEPGADESDIDEAGADARA